MGVVGVGIVDGDKHSSLLQRGMNCPGKKFLFESPSCLRVRMTRFDRKNNVFHKLKLGSLLC